MYLLCSVVCCRVSVLGRAASGLLTLSVMPSGTGTPAALRPRALAIGRPADEAAMHCSVPMTIIDHHTRRWRMYLKSDSLPRDCSFKAGACRFCGQ